jgi:hypothetical protein
VRVETLRSAAVKYAARGWRVFPIQAPIRGNAKSGKLPLFPECPNGGHGKCDGDCGNVGHGSYDATSDTATVDAWWEVHPNANIGLQCGPGSGVWVLDVDVKVPKARKPGEVCVAGVEALAELEAVHGALPETMRARTGSSGVHHIWRMPPGRALKNRGTIVLPDGRRASIDVRAGERSGGTWGLDKLGHIVLPPSAHYSGGRYEWIDEQAPTDAPAWLLDLVAPVESPKPREWTRPALVAEDDPKRKYAAKVLDSACADIASSQTARHDTLNVRAFTLGGYIAGGYIAREVVERALYDAAIVSMGEGREREIRRTIADALNEGETKPIEIPDRPGATVPDPPAWMVEDEAPPPDDDDAPGARVHVLPPPEPPRATPAGPKPWQVAAAPAPAVEPEDGPALPKINITKRQAAEVISDAWRALKRRNLGAQPELYLTGGRLARLRRSEQGVVINPCEPVHVQSLLIRAARWTKSVKAPAHVQTADGFIEVDAEVPPEFIGNDMVAFPAEDLPVLEQVVYGPTFDADGSLLGDPGYCPTAHRWYEETRPIEPVQLSLDEARDVLLDWLADFPFASNADRAHAIGLFLLPFVRDLVGDMTPIHLVEAPMVGSGKTLLARVILSAAMGFIPAIQPWPEREEERMKTIGAELRNGAPVIVFDNVKGRVESPSLEAATTTSRFSARILGGLDSMNVRVRAIWLLTANNAALSPDLVRRTVRIRLVPSAPFDYATARHPDIIGWTLDNHSLLVSAALRLVVEWIRVGRPEGRETLGTYETWAKVVGGILATAGIPGFLTGREEFKSMADPISVEWEEFVAAWSHKFGPDLKSAKDLLELATDRGLLGRLVEKCGSEHSKITTFGDRLREKVDNVIGGNRISRRKSGSWGYHLVRVSGEPQEPGALFPSEVPV